MTRSEKKAANRAAHAAARAAWQARIEAEQNHRVMMHHDEAAKISVGDTIQTDHGASTVLRIGRPYYNAKLGFAAWIYHEAPAPVAPAPKAKAQRPAAAPRRPETLIAFLARNGGLRRHGDLLAMDLDKVFVPGVGKLVRRHGLGESLDAARLRAEEAGYLKAGSDINDLLEALDEDNRGRRIVAARDMGDELTHMQTGTHEENEAAWAAYLAQVDETTQQEAAEWKAFVAKTMADHRAKISGVAHA